MLPTATLSAPALLLQSRKYSVSVATNAADYEAAIQLRYQVFHEEMGAQPITHQIYLDEDIFDPVCHHLVLRDNQNGEVVGTYRMQTYEMALEGQGFYTALEFDLTDLPEETLQSAVEIGRLCIAKPHRNSRALMLLWKGLARYIILQQKTVFFGCSSLFTESPTVAYSALAYFRNNNLLHSEYYLRAQPGYRCQEPTITIEDMPSKEVVPQLVQVYLRFGAKICSEPGWDPEFKTMDFLTLCNINEMPANYYNLFFNQDEKVT